MSRTQILRHMAERDIPLFATFYNTPEGQSYDAWEFDVLVGDPEEPGAFYPANVRRQALYLNALKIDAIGWFLNTPTLIECKPNAGLGAIGQVLGYREWYRIIFGIQPGMKIVCQRMTRQIQTLCAINEIAVRIVTPATEIVTWAAINHIQFKIQTKSIMPEMASVQ